MQRDQLHQQHQRINTIRRPRVLNPQCLIGSENYPEQEKNVNMLFI